jgi:hypothetical protein
MLTKVDIRHLIRRPINNNRPHRAPSILRLIMRMVPSSPIKLRPESINHARAGRNSALRDSRHTVHMVRLGLQEAVPVHARALVFELIGDFDLDGVAVVGFEEGAGELAVDADCSLGLDAVGADGALCDGEVVGSDGAGVWAGSGVV